MEWVGLRGPATGPGYWSGKMGRHAARRACPFCDWAYTDALFRLVGRHHGAWFVRCCSCGARGSEGETKAEAVAAWQRAARGRLHLVSDQEVG